jgi:NitT/TauT family transport system substrate-binding protein
MPRFRGFSTVRHAIAMLVLCAAMLGVEVPGAAAATRLTIGYIPVLGSAQLFIIDGEGWAKQADIELVTTRFDSGPAMIQALASGKLDMYLAGIGPIMVARGQGVNVHVVAAAAIEELAVIARGPFADSIERGLSLPDAVHAFAQGQKRKPKIATQPLGSVPDTVLRYWLDPISKVALGDVEILGIGIDATQQAFLSGAVDAAVVREPTLTLIRDRDPTTKLVAAGAQMFPNQPGSVLAALATDDTNKRAAIIRFISLHIRATEMLTKEPKRAAPPILKALGAGIIKLDVVERALVSPSSHFVADPAVIVDATAKMQDYQIALGVLKQAVPVDQIFDHDSFQRARQ